MHFSSLKQHAKASCRKRILLLAFSWITGLLLGAYAAYRMNDSVFALMRTDMFSGVSIVKSFFVYIFPVLLTALASFISPFLFFPIAFSKAVSFGFASVCISNAFPDAGWLLRPLIMFSDIGAISIIVWLWIRCTITRKKLVPGIFLACIISIAVFCVIDHCVLVPFISKLAVY